MLTIQQIIRRTPKQRIHMAQYVKLVKVKIGYNSQGQGFVAAQSYSTHEYDYTTHTVRRVKGTPTKYVTVITFVDKKLRCKVSCSCPDFMYRWEVALNKKNAADIEYSNGDAPTTTNPGMVTASCKHLVKLYQHIAPKLPSK